MLVVKINPQPDAGSYDVQKAEDIIAGIAKYVNKYKYKKGFRNNMAVDMCIACYVLRLDPYDTMNLFGVVTFGVGQDMLHDFKKRADVIEKYTPRWATPDLDCIWNYTLMYDTWKDFADNAEIASVVKFKQE